MKRFYISLLLALMALPMMAGNTITYTALEKLAEASANGSGINPNAFYNATTQLTITSHTFSGETGTITFSDDVTVIGDYAFDACFSLTSVTIPDGVTKIGYCAFGNCWSLTSATLPESVTEVADWAFYGCYAMERPICNSHIFAHMPDSYYGSYTIPDGVEEIVGGAFYACTDMTSVSIPGSVRRIGPSAFYSCWSLTSLTLPDSLTTLCSTGLASVTMLPAAPPAITHSTFEGCFGLTDVTVPCGCYTAYAADSLWSELPLEERQGVRLTLSAADEAMGTVSGGDEWGCPGDTVIITATPAEGYEFAQWSDGNTDNPRTLVLTQDTQLQAIFRARQSDISNAEAAPSARKVFRDGNLHIRRGEHIYDANGRIVE